MSYLKFFVKENGRPFSVSEMSEPETAAIAECVDQLIPNTYQYTSDYWLEVETCLIDEEFRDEEPEYGIVRCYTQNPNPKNGSLGESRLHHPFPKELAEKLYGKIFHVTPRQLGLNPWGHSVEIIFEDPRPKTPLGGIKASALIAAALAK
jgi:hypothetical protein